MKISERLEKKMLGEDNVKNYMPNKLKDILGLIEEKLNSLDFTVMSKHDEDAVLYVLEKLKTIDKMFKG